MLGKPMETPNKTKFFSQKSKFFSKFEFFVDNFPTRLDLCIQANGGHFEWILFFVLYIKLFNFINYRMNGGGRIIPAHPVYHLLIGLVFDRWSLTGQLTGQSNRSIDRSNRSTVICGQIAFFWMIVSIIRLNQAKFNVSLGNFWVLFAKIFSWIIKKLPNFFLLKIFAKKIKKSKRFLFKSFKE